jgi:CRISPR system Cascade subunit CasD
MSDALFLRFEGPLQAWGSHQAKFAVRRTMKAPTKSGVFGLLASAAGIEREETPDWLRSYTALRMGVRIDRPGMLWWDYHTVGAEQRMPTAKGTKFGAMLSRRQYLCDASFLVVLLGAAEEISYLKNAIEEPRWTPFLGRRNCVPSRPIPLAASEVPQGSFETLPVALAAVPLRPRLFSDEIPKKVELLLDFEPSAARPNAPQNSEVWYDVPIGFEQPGHQARFVVRDFAPVGKDGLIRVNMEPSQLMPTKPFAPRADYRNEQYRKMRLRRLCLDSHLCIFCKCEATTVQHVTYEHAGGNESIEELRSLCRLCHDAITMIEYGENMGIVRINPEEERWRERILVIRQSIINNRSLETRRRWLASSPSTKGDIE